MLLFVIFEFLPVYWINMTKRYDQLDNNFYFHTDPVIKKKLTITLFFIRQLNKVENKKLFILPCIWNIPIIEDKSIRPNNSFLINFLLKRIMFNAFIYRCCYKLFNKFIHLEPTKLKLINIKTINHIYLQDILTMRLIVCKARKYM